MTVTVIELNNSNENNIAPPVYKIKAIPQGFDPSRAIELGNLVRIAYKDYDNDKNQKSCLKEGDIILTDETDMSTKTIAQYWINSSDSSNRLWQYKVNKILKSKEITDSRKFGFILERKSQQNEIIYFLVFRGTIEPYEWLKDIIFELSSPSFNYNIKNNRNIEIKVSKGFQEIYGYPDDNLSINNTVQKFLDELAKDDNKDTKKIYVTGHSLGAAIATLSTFHIIENDFKPILYAFASPRVGNKGFAQQFQSNYNQIFRIANCEDLVNDLPTGTITNLIGDEMKPEPDNLLTKIINILPSEFKSIFNTDAYEHIGQPVYFSHQTGAISSNHNMTITYCGALPIDTSN